MEAKGKEEEASLSSSSVAPAETIKKKKKNRFVFLDISIGQKRPGRLIIELFADIVPKTAKNFRLLCTGEKGVGPDTGAPLHYKGTVFHRIVPGGTAQGGDIENKKGRGGESAFGGFFKDETSQQHHSEPGLLSMMGYHDKNGSTFFITFAPKPQFRNVVVFGKVIKGLKTLEAMSNSGTPEGEPQVPVTITDCGEIISRNEIKNLRAFIEGGGEKTGKSAIFYNSAMSTKNHSFVFLDISIGKDPAERLVLELAPDSVGITVKEFLAYCTGIYEKKGFRLHYKGAVKHRGKTVEGHSGPGMLYFEISGPFDKNGLLLFICFSNKSKGGWLATGKVIKGKETVRKINEMEGGPKSLVTITARGEIVCEDEINKLMNLIEGEEDKIEAPESGSTL